MAITLRSRREIELMRRAGALVAKVLSKLEEVAEPGVTTAWLDRMALEMTLEAGAEALFKGVRSPVSNTPFPGDSVEGDETSGWRSPERGLRGEAQRVLWRRRRNDRRG
jgi:hypothetical protein